MTRISRKVLSYILGAIASLAIVFGVLAARPQMWTANAETPVTFNAAVLGDASDETYGTSIRFNTAGQTWATYHNWVSADAWKSIADYTTVNGRTVTEINNATTHTQKITLMMQPAGSFSFLRLYIPSEIIPLGEVKSMGILDGWSFNNGADTFTSSAVTFLRQGDVMVTAENYSATEKLTASNITIGDAKLANIPNPTWGTDSYQVEINIGKQVTTEYNTMYAGYKQIRNAIYINGKSIEEWNTQMIAKDARFQNPATYAFFPQNSTDPSHLDPFVKPIGLWCTSTGFRLSIFQELVADCESITVSVGAGCFHAGNFIVSETVSKVVHTQQVVDVTEKLTFLDNRSPDATYNNTTHSYYIHTNNEKCWTKSPVGGCLNECDPMGKGGGQVQMKYIYFNGTSLYDINKADDGSYGSAQGNIASGGGYAPIFAGMSTELGSTLKLLVPDQFTNGKAGHEEIIIKKGFNVYENGVSYYVSQDVIFTNTGNGWNTEIKANEIETEVTGIITYANRTDGGNNENFVIFQLSDNDYAGLNTAAINDLSSLYGYIDIDGNVLSSKPGEPFFNVWGIQNSIAFRAPGLDAAGLQQVKYITIKAGARFPAYTTQNGGAKTYYVTTEDVTFIHKGTNDTWTVGTYVPEETKTSVMGISNNGAYAVLQLDGYVNPEPNGTEKNNNASIEKSNIADHITYVDGDGEKTAENAIFRYYTQLNTNYPNSIGIIFGENMKKADLEAVTSITIAAGTKFPSYAYASDTTGTVSPCYYVTNDTITYYQISAGTWSTTPPEPEVAEVDITADIGFVHQVSNSNTKTETYMIHTSGKQYWTDNPQGGCLNEYDPQNAGGGQEQMNYIYFNGVSLYEINKGDDASYGSTHPNIASGGIYAPILVTMGVDKNVAVPYSYIQIHVPTGYPNEGATASENHTSIELKAGFSVTIDNTTWYTTKDFKWINLNGTWKSADEDMIDADDISFENHCREGDVYKVDIVSNAWNVPSTFNYYDLMYGSYATERQNIFINGVSIYDINATTDDSGYVYKTFPMTGADDAIFAHPILIQTHAQNGGDPNTITIWIHEQYLEHIGNELTISFKAGYSNRFMNGAVLSEDVSHNASITVNVNDGKDNMAYTMLLGDTVANVLGTPTKDMTNSAMYEFAGWYIAGTNTIYDPTVALSANLSVEARFTETAVNFIETELLQVEHQLKTTTDNWLTFLLSEHDYKNAAENYIMDGRYTELIRIGFLDKIILKGTIDLNGTIVSEATLMDVYDTYGVQQGPLMNIWAQGKLGIRVPVGSGVTEVVVESGCYFPSYDYVSKKVSVDTRYVVTYGGTYFHQENSDFFYKKEEAAFDIQMVEGASVRIKDIKDDFEGDASQNQAYATSGIRFTTQVAVADLDKLKEGLNDGTYKSVSFYTLIVPTSDLMGGQFTFEWLEKNVSKFKNIECTAGFYQTSDGWDYAFPEYDEAGTYARYHGSLVQLQEKNYTRWFSGLGYIAIEMKDGSMQYVYAPYASSNSRSIAYVAHAAVNDRITATKPVGDYKYVISVDNYSRYTRGVNNFLAVYTGSLSDNAVDVQKLDNLVNKGGTQTITLNTEKLAGAYVTLSYKTNVNVWGVFTYTDGSKTANEDFYLRAGTTQHRQYLDIYRYNGVGFGMDETNLQMTSITFTNAELATAEVPDGQVEILGFVSAAGTMTKQLTTAYNEGGGQEIYLTVNQKDGSQMTVGAHLGLGGSLTYLAKSGIYEGVIGGNSGWDQGTVALRTNTSEFDAENKHKSGTGTNTYSTEKGWYGNGTTSNPVGQTGQDMPVNLINNFDAGRQIQQSWYAEVGGSSTTATGANNYNRAYCYTGSTAGQYWPYNPVQAGDVVSNPGQIIDYEIKQPNADGEGGYIYVKARAMDWAQGKDTVNKADREYYGTTVEGGITTKSYVENYYRLNADGTLYVNNAFVDWNGFPDMESCDWSSTELPAVYPVHTLNYYVSNLGTDEANKWASGITGLTYKNDMKPWSGGTALHQFSDPSRGNAKVEEWFAWANGNTKDSIALGMYIPNVAQFTSGRSYTSTSYYTDVNFQNSNALPVDNYTKTSWFTKQDMVSDHAERGNILLDKGMMSNMQPVTYTYQSTYVSNTSYTAPGINFRMEAYKPIEYTYVIAVNTVENVRSTFKNIYENGTVTNAGKGTQKIGLDAWARADKQWTW